MNTAENLPYVKGDKGQDSKVCRCVSVHLQYVPVLAKQEGSIRSKPGSRAESPPFPRGIGSGIREEAGKLSQAPGPFKGCTHTCGDMQQIVKALPSYA